MADTNDLIRSIVVGLIWFIIGCIHSYKKKKTGTWGHKDVSSEGVDEWQAIVDVPSEQHEIVRCMDCRWGRETCGNIECFANVNGSIEYHSFDWFRQNGERKDDG